MLAVPEVPDRVAGRAVEVLGTAAPVWLASAPGRVAAGARVWGVSELANVELGRGSWLLSGRHARGPVLLKAPFVFPRPHVCAQRALAAAGSGPDVLGYRAGVLLLERIAGLDVAAVLAGGLTPGRARRTIDAACEALGTLTSVPAAGTAPLTTWLRSRLVEAPTDVSSTSVPPTPTALATALATLDALGTDPAHACHGDANLGNIVLADTGRVLLVDARGVHGDIAYDVAVLAAKAASAGLGVDRTAMAVRAGADPDRAAAWALVAAAARV